MQHKYLLLLTATLVLSGCSTRTQHIRPTSTLPVFVPTPSTAVSMACANHTDTYISAYSVQEPRTLGRGMIYALSCHAYEMGNGIVAAGFLFPDQWQPGMKVKVRWKPSARDWIEKVTTIKRYDRAGRLYIHFFENDEVRVVSSEFYPTSPNHPIPQNVTVAPPEAIDRDG